MSFGFHMKFTRHRELIVVFAIISAVNVACDCSANQVWFYGGGQSSGIWNEPDNWYGGVPTRADHANLNTGGVHCIIDTNHINVDSAVCARLTLPDWENAGDTNEYCYLDMNGCGLTKLPTQVTGENKWQCVLPPYSLTVVTFSRDN
jgi:hypothetical protein